MKLMKYTFASVALSVLALLSACTSTPPLREAAAPSTVVGHNVSKDGILQFCSSGVTQSGLDYNFTGTCTINPPPAGRYLSGPVKYPRQTNGVNYDLTLWENMWGRSAYNSPPVAVLYPGISGSTPIINPPVGQSVALAFRIPAGTHMGQYKVPPEWSTNSLDLSISVNPGDFGLNALNPKCLALGPQSYNQPVLNFTTDAAANPTYKCELINGGTYYLNIRRMPGGGYGNVGVVYQGS